LLPVLLILLLLLLLLQLLTVVMKMMIVMMEWRERIDDGRLFVIVLRLLMTAVLCLTARHIVLLSRLLFNPLVHNWTSLYCNTTTDTPGLDGWTFTFGPAKKG